MCKKNIFIIVLLVTGAFFCFAQTGDGEKILNMLKAQNNSGVSLKFTMNFENHNAGGDIETAQFKVYAQWNPAKDDKESIALQQEPVRDQGKIYLVIGQNYWIYFPKTKRASALSAAQAVLGQASTGDFLAPPLLRWYTATTSALDNGQTQIVLTAKDTSAPYGKIVQYYQGLQLLRAEQYSRSGVKIKEAEYSDYDTGLDGYPRARTVKIINALVKDSYTIIKQGEQTKTEIPSAWFNPLNLGQVK